MIAIALVMRCAKCEFTSDFMVFTWKIWLLRSFWFVKVFLAVVLIFSFFGSCAEYASVKLVPCLLMEQIQHIATPRVLGCCVLLILHRCKLTETGPFSLGFDGRELCLQLPCLHHCLSGANLKNSLSLQWGRHGANLAIQLIDQETY